MSAARLREKAALCLRLAKMAMSVDAAAGLRRLATEYEDAARQAEARQAARRQAAGQATANQ